MSLTLNCGFRTIGTAVHLVVPASFLVLVGDLCGFARRGLLARRKFRSRASGVAGGERLGIRTIRLVGPPAVVLNNFISDLAHISSNTSYFVLSVQKIVQSANLPTL